MTKTHRIALLEGDGIGREVMAEARLLLESLHHARELSVTLDGIPCGGQYFLEHGGERDWPKDAAARCAAADVILLGAVGYPHPSGKGVVSFADGRMAGFSAVLGNRHDLDLYANVRPVKLLAGVRHKLHGRLRTVWRPGKVDLVIVRENTEGLYAGAGGRLGPASRAVALDERIITRAGSERVIRYAFNLARARRGAKKDARRRVTCVGKDNVLFGCKLFAEVFFEVAAEFADVEAETLLVDTFAARLVCEPERFDVCVTTNLFGDILTDLAAVLQGGMGMAASGNIGEEHAMFEPIHGSAPDLPAGQANPLAMFLAVAMGLDWLGARRDDSAVRRVAAAIEQAVATLVARQKDLTVDLIPKARAVTTARVGEAVRELVARALATFGSGA